MAGSLLHPSPLRHKMSPPWEALGPFYGQHTLSRVPGDIYLQCTYDNRAWIKISNSQSADFPWYSTALGPLASRNCMRLIAQAFIPLM